jgi:EAL domain-containing protein (putative c-di-GMP-specific phosphodiesterase class I)
VKIDRAFLIDIQHDSVNQAIVQAVTTLAHSIGMRVVAEGIETTEQLDLARSLGCDEAQGYLISRPVSTDEATVWLDAQYGHELRRRVVRISEAR